MRVIVAVDGSPQSSYAVQALAHFGPLEEVTLVHATALPDLDHPMITPELRDSVLLEVKEKLIAQGKELLNAAVAKLSPNCKKIERVHEVGSPSMVILETAKSAHADLILIGARGLGPVKELLLGSVSHRVVLHAPCSTMVFHSPLSQVKHLLLPVEGQDDGDRIINFVSRIGFPIPLRVSVMTIWAQPRLPWPMTLGQSKLLESRALDHAQDMVGAIAEQLKGKGYDSAGVVGLGDPAFAILEQARSLKPDLILVGSHGRKGLSRFMLGSVSHTLVHQASCPLVVVR